MSKVVTGVFATRRDAQRAVERLVEAGFDPASISVMMSDAAKEREIARDHPSGAPDPAAAGAVHRAAEGATAGGTIGGTIGAVIGGLAAVGSIAIPGVGLIAAGPIVAALAGAGAGGAAGGLFGALVGLGISESEAGAVKAGLEQGRIVVAVETSVDRATRAVAVLRGEGSLEVAAH
jgi:hypothetical protein